MVAPIQAIPCPTMEPHLPAVEDPPQLLHGEGTVRPFIRQPGASVHMHELEHHAQFRPGIPRVLQAVRHAYMAGLPHAEHVVGLKHPGAHLLQKFVYAGAVVHIGEAVSIEQAGFPIQKPLVLGDHVDPVQPEPIHALFLPKQHDGINGFPHRRIFPVEIRLFRQEAVHIILPGQRVQRPGRARKDGAPVGGGAVPLPVPPDIIVPIGVLPAFPALQEPGMLIRGVVGHHVQHDPDAPRLCPGDHPFQVFHGTVDGVYGPVIRNIVAVVLAWGSVHRADPQHGDPQLRKVIQLFPNAAQVADPIPIAIVKAAGIYLIYHRFLPPRRFPVHINPHPSKRPQAGLRPALRPLFIHLAGLFCSAPYLHQTRGGAVVPPITRDTGRRTISPSCRSPAMIPRSIPKASLAFWEGS